MDDDSFPFGSLEGELRVTSLTRPRVAVVGLNSSGGTGEPLVRVRQHHRGRRRFASELCAGSAHAARVCCVSATDGNASIGEGPLLVRR